jgi:PAS domain S-box-containing protein
MQFFNSVKALYAAVGVLSLMFVLGYYLDAQNDTMKARHLGINIELEKMIRFEQELTNMISLAIVEQNVLRTTRYETVSLDVEASTKHLLDLTKDQSINPQISALGENLKKIRNMEAVALEQIRKDQWKEARDVLFGDEYLSAKKTYEIDSEAIPGLVRGEIEGIEKRFDRLKSAALYAQIGALCLLVWTGIMFSRRTRADLAEQVRLQTEISAANAVLEERVLARTEELGLLLQSAGEGIFGVDARGQITFVNPVALNLLGFAEEEMIGKEVYGLIHHSQQDGSRYPREDCPLYNTCTGGTQMNVTDEVFWRKDGQGFPAEYSSTPIIKNGKVMGAVVTFRDVTERTRVEKELKEHMEDLERFSRLTIDREEKMIQLKEEINGLLEQTGQEKKYTIVA